MHSLDRYNSKVVCDFVFQPLDSNDIQALKIWKAELAYDNYNCTWTVCSQLLCLDYPHQ